jgi:hypothetical protein
MQILGRIAESDIVILVLCFAWDCRETLGRSAMRLTTEIIAALAAAVLVFCLTASSAAFAAGEAASSADGLSCAFSVPQNASPAARCAALKHQCGGKFWANYCGGKLLSAS